MLTKKLIKIGSSVGCTFPKSVLQLLKIDEETTMEITTDGHSITLTPISKEDRFQDAMENATRDHSEAFERLAK